MNQLGSFATTRRGFLALGAGTAAAALLASCGSGGSGTSDASKPLKFWNMPWGPAGLFDKVDKEIVDSYEPPEGFGPVEYQLVQWPTFTQTFASAIASNTGPAVSSGSGTQAFQYAAQGKIAYAHDLIDSWKSNGLHDDFQPGILDTLKTDEGYAAIPYLLDTRVLWRNQKLFDRAGAEAPTDWQSYLDACEALKKIGVFGFGTGSGAGSALGGQVLIGLMINNGGGIFDEEQQPNCVTPQNIEAIEFVIELVKKGYSDPGAISYTTDNARTQWAEERFGMGWTLPSIGGVTDPAAPAAADLVLNQPLTSPNGTKGALLFIANIMMYTNTPSQDASEAFLTYYYQNMHRLWTEKTGLGLPVLKSITETPEFSADLVAKQVIDEWIPIGKTLGSPGSNTVFHNVAAVDGTQAPNNFAQAVLSGETDARSALSALQDELVATLPES